MADATEEQAQGPQIPAQLQGVLDENPLQVDVSAHLSTTMQREEYWLTINPGRRR